MSTTLKIQLMGIFTLFFGEFRKKSLLIQDAALTFLTCHFHFKNKLFVEYKRSHGIKINANKWSKVNNKQTGTLIIKLKPNKQNKIQNKDDTHNLDPGLPSTLRHFS